MTIAELFLDRDQKKETGRTRVKVRPREPQDSSGFNVSQDNIL